MYNIKILTECNDENIKVAIISAILEALGGDSSIVINKLKRGNVNSPIWNSISRQENLSNKF